MNIKENHPMIISNMKVSLKHVLKYYDINQSKINQTVIKIHK